MKVQAYVFIDSENPGPKKIVAAVRKIAGVVHVSAPESGRVQLRESPSTMLGRPEFGWLKTLKFLAPGRKYRLCYDSQSSRRLALYLEGSC